MFSIKFISHQRPLLWNPCSFISINKNLNFEFYTQKGFRLLGIPEEEVVIFEVKSEKSIQKVDDVKKIIIDGIQKSLISKRVYDLTKDVTKEYIDTYYIMIEDGDGPRIFKINPIKWNLGVFDLIEVSINDLKRETD